MLFKEKSPYEWFLDNDFRKLFISKLSINDIKNISSNFGLKSEDPYLFFSKLKLNKKNLIKIKEIIDFEEFQFPAKKVEEINHTSASIKISPSYPLFEHQNDIYLEVRDKLRRKPHRLLMHMPTGSGKTRTAMNVICDFLRNNEFNNHSILWIADRFELCEQAALEFEKSWSILGNKKLKVTRLYSGLLKNIENLEFNNSFIVVSIQQLLAFRQNNNKFFLSFPKFVGMVVFDETHLITAPQYSEIVDALTPSPETYLLGLTATPGRSYLDQDEDLKLAKFFNHQKCTLKVVGYDNPINYLTDQGYLAKIQNDLLELHNKNFDLSEDEKNIIFDGKKDIPKSLREKISNDVERKGRVLKKILSYATNKNNKILVFCGSVKEAEFIAKVIQHFDYKIFSITEGTSSSRRQWLIEEFKKESSEVQILTNYGVLTTGFDAPKTNIAIITRPISSVVLYNQIVGRVARGKKAGGNETCTVVNVVDKGYGFRDLSESFLFWDDIW